MAVTSLDSVISFPASLGTKAGEKSRKAGRSRVLLRSLFVHYVFISLELSIRWLHGPEPLEDKARKPVLRAPKLFLFVRRAR